MEIYKWPNLFPIRIKGKTSHTSYNFSLNSFVEFYNTLFVLSERRRLVIVVVASVSLEKSAERSSPEKKWKRSQKCLAYTAICRPKSKDIRTTMITSSSKLALKWASAWILTGSSDIKWGLILKLWTRVVSLPPWHSWFFGHFDLLCSEIVLWPSL